MKILILSDTHIPAMAKSLPPQVIAEAKEAQMCLHAGDFIAYSVFEELSSYVTTIGVCGNMDQDEIKQNLAQKEIIEVEDIRIGLFHGRGAPQGLMPLLRNEFKKEWDSIHVFVFGHSHQAEERKINGKVFFNPGSPVDSMFAVYKSYGIMEIDKGKISTKIIKI
jgi:putative phosphoesterase